MIKFVLSFVASLTILFSISVFAEDDPNPNSPTPILLSQPNSAQALAVESNNWNGKIPNASDDRFLPDSRKSITLFLTNVELMPNENANSFRVYLFQKSDKTFELQVDELIPIDKSVYALKVRLYDPNGYRGQPQADGESLIYLTWRGLSSNALKISLGRSGGVIKYPNYLTSEKPKAAEPTSTDYVGYLWSGDRVRFLEQATFGPTTMLDSRIRRIGLRVWLAEQFNAPYPTIPYPSLSLMPTIPDDSCSMNTFPACYRQNYTMQPVQQWFYKEAFYGDAQLRHRIAWSLGQIWVTSGVTVQQPSHMLAYQKVLADNAFGNYRDLMYQVTLNPTMGNYLDMARSTKNIPNENYAREILQLFSIGLFRLNQDGSIIRDSNNNPVPTYDQETINNFAKVFTGWSFCQGASCPNGFPGRVNYFDPMTLTPANHDLTDKTLLNYPNAVSQNIQACQNCTTDQERATYANNSLNKALDNIFNHPNLPPYISRLLIQQLVTSDPSPAYVQRVADVFVNNGQNVRGDMKSIIKAILLDPEARGDKKTAPRYGKLREPVQLMTNLGRIFPAKSADGQSLSDGGLSFWMDKMKQNAFNSPTVFNYFPPDYVVPGTTLNAPEFGLLNTSTGINRANFIHVLIFERITPNVTDSLRGTSLDFTEAIAAAGNDATANQLLDYLNNKMMHGSLTAEHRALIQNAVQAVPAADTAQRVKTAVYLIAVSSQYQIQR